MEKVSLSILCVVVVSGIVCVNTLMAQDYIAIPYAQYSSATASGRMAMDDMGNLYIAHYDDGKIIKIDPTRQDTLFVSGLGNLYDITWAGGTSYGDNLYVSSRTPDFSDDKILQIDLNGNVTAFASMTPPQHAVTFVGIDQTGNYGGSMFSSGSIRDQLYRISTSGHVNLFSNWPGQTSGGGPYGIDFDLSGKYNNSMYVANSFPSQNANISGLFAIAPDGTASRFANDIVAAYNVVFDHTGVYFDHDMFVLGRTSFAGNNALWRVYADGSVEELPYVRSLTFGNDGAMYISMYDEIAQQVQIYRVVPEPATLLLWAAGGLLLRKRPK